MQTRTSPPETRRAVVVDELHGQQIEDPYRWLEDGESPETQAWVEEQNAYTRSLLDVVPGREAIQERLSELLAIGLVTAPVVRNGRAFYQRREGQQNQPVLYLEDEAGEVRPVVDPNRASDEGTVALDWSYPSWDGRFLAYGYSANGDEWSTLYVLDVDSGEVLPDHIERTRYASVSWLPDSSGFYYTRYPFGGEVPEGEENYHKRLFFHRLGDDPASDPELFGAQFEKEAMLSTSITPDGRYLLAHVYHGWERLDLFLRDLADPDGSFVPVAEGYDALFHASIGGGWLYLHTNLDAPRYRLLRTPVDRPEREHWMEIIPEAEDVLVAVALSNGRVVAEYLHNATSALSLHESDGARIGTIPLPTLGTVTQIQGRWEQKEVFFGFQSFVVPPTVYRLSPAGDALEVWASVEAPIHPEDYEVKQEWYTSRDGTRVSIFIVHRRGLDPSTTHPTLLTGYGGFNDIESPIFGRGLYLWLEHGGVFALPNLRGGAEYGEDWHRAGMLDRKQNVFDDFIAAAEHLIDRGYAEPSKLVITGGSNGGLLVGAALTQRPDLFRAVVCAVPLLDMLRYHLYQIARLWIPEYGSAENPEHFPHLYRYSPYHNVQEEMDYPAVLLTTAESDTRVDPFHARKMAALLQAATSSDRPILLRVETRAGHGQGKPLTKLIDEQTDMWSFLFWQLGVEV